MAFSWKNAKKRAIAEETAIVQIYLKAGRNVEADKLKAKIKRMKDNA